MKSPAPAFLILLPLLAGCSGADVSPNPPRSTEEAYYQGMQYLLGQGTEPDTARGIALLEQAAEPEKLSKTSLLGSLFGSPVPVQQGSPDAQRMLGQLYVFGQGVDADWERGIGLYLKAAMQGDGASQAALGIAYEQGLGVQQHLPTASAWFRLSAEQNLNVDGMLGMERVGLQMSAEEKSLSDELFAALSAQIE